MKPHPTDQNTEQIMMITILYRVAEWPCIFFQLWLSVHSMYSLLHTCTPTVLFPWQHNKETISLWNLVPCISATLGAWEASSLSITHNHLNCCVFSSIGVVLLLLLLLYSISLRDIRFPVTLGSEHMWLIQLVSFLISFLAAPLLLNPLSTFHSCWYYLC